MDLHTVPKLGDTRVTDVQRADVAKVHLALRGTPRQANRVLAVLRTFFKWCESRGLRPDGTNPCRHVQTYREDGRERHLGFAEMAVLGQAIRDCETGAAVSPAAATAAQLLLLTGARLNEILTLNGPPSISRPAA